MSTNRRTNKKPVKRKKKPTRKTTVLLNIVVVLLVLLGSVFLYILTERKTNSNQVVVALDARHDSKHPGIQAYCNELEYDNQIVDALETKLKADHQFKVVRTHEKDTDASSKTRGKAIEKANADIVLSFGLNESAHEDQKGMQIYVAPPTNKGHKKGLVVADMIKMAFENEVPTPSVSCYYYEKIGNDVFAPRIVDATSQESYEEDTLPLFENTNKPAVIVNRFYATNKEEAETYTKEEEIEKTADLYYQALKKVYGGSR